MATWPTVTDDDGTGTTGTILDNALFSSVRDYIGASWSAVTYAAGDFTASAGTWTVASGDVNAFRYVEIGKTMHVSLNLQTTTIATTAPAELRVTVPNGRTIAGSCSGSFAYYANGTYGSGLWSATSGTYVSLFRDVPATVWPICTDLVYIYATMTFEIA